MSRIDPVQPPYDDDTERSLRRWMPPGVAQDPLVLFRTLHRHPELASRMFPLGAGLLAHGTLPDADREIVIARTTALAGCVYEWGVHDATFAQWVGLSPEQRVALITAQPTTEAEWEPRHAALLAATDALHASARLSHSTWKALREHYDDQQLIEFLVLAGWYRTISYVANGLELEEEAWATRLPPRPEHAMPPTS